MLIIFIILLLHTIIIIIWLVPCNKRLSQRLKGITLPSLLPRLELNSEENFLTPRLQSVAVFHGLQLYDLKSASRGGKTL